ncbi:13821_t:CDS:2 [Acaulospora colombiana]|uniref:13821_t:CDS:1 n=1 Tax=Acaulospora colombiana TaxID=27376 RepID=A0ACA9LSG5_9GLOM|nr:13821_t:CDS:2 [Acaulospora colombiana]
MIIRTLILLFVFLTCFTSSSPAPNYSPHSHTKIFNLDIKKVQLAPDGFTRDVLTINGTLPGPTIRITKGDRVILNVCNELDEPSTIHSHGLFQRGTNWYDGVPGETQCGIPAHTCWNYNFSVPDQSGTYWYHSHFKTQYVDGIFGAFIVDDPDDPYLHEYEEEIVIILQDYYHTEASELLKYYLSPASQGNEPIPDNGLINGLGRFNCSLAPEGSKCVNNFPLAKFTFESGKVYRLRIINTSAFSVFFFSIDQHELEVIEADGTYVKPAKVHRLPINVAQRYSVLVRANQVPSSYWMRSEFQEDCFPVSADNLTDTVRAIVTYKDCPEKHEPITSDWKDNLTQCVDLKPSLLRPLFPEKIPTSEKTFKFVVTFHNNSEGVNTAYINNSTYEITLDSPTLQEVFYGETKFPKSQNAYLIEKKEHGHQFWILAEGNGTDVKTSKFNTKDPLKRDTATVPAQGWIALRFVADNPGVWAFHCHIEWHVEAGLVVKFIELPDEIKKLHPPEYWSGLCSMR